MGGDFNVIRFPSERSARGRLTWAMRDFSAFIDSCNLIDPPLEGATSLGLAMKLFQCYRALTGFFIRSSGKFTSKGFIRLFSRRLLQITFPFFFGWGKFSQVDDLSNLKICGLRWMAFVTLSILFGIT